MKALKEAYSAPYGTSCTYRRGGASIGLIRTGPGFDLVYKSRRGPYDEWTDCRDSVGIESRPAPFGGKRLFMICPCCRTSRTALYGSAPFACRTCHGLTYPSQIEKRIYAQYDTGQEIANKLAGRYVTLGEPFPPRPKGMHKRTYEAKRARWDRLTSPARNYAERHVFGHEGEPWELLRVGLDHKRAKEERREAKRAERNRAWVAKYYESQAC